MKKSKTESRTKHEIMRHLASLFATPTDVLGNRSGYRSYAVALPALLLAAFPPSERTEQGTQVVRNPLS